MRKAMVLTPRGKRKFWRVNCFKDGALLLTVDCVTEKKAEECRKLWDEGANRRQILSVAYLVVV